MSDYFKFDGICYAYDKKDAKSRHGPFELIAESGEQAIIDSDSYGPIRTLELRKIVSKPLETSNITLDRYRNKNLSLMFVAMSREGIFVWVKVPNIQSIRKRMDFPYILYQFVDCDYHLMGDDSLDVRVCDSFEKQLYSAFRTDGTMVYKKMPKTVDFADITSIIDSSNLDCDNFYVYSNTFKIYSEEEGKKILLL